MSKNKVKFGLENVHIAFIDDQGEYETPIHVEGAVNLSASPEGEETEFYADNKKYFLYTSNDGYTGDLEMANIPDEVIAEMLGDENRCKWNGCRISR